MSAGDWDGRYAASPLLWGENPNRFVEERCSGLSPGHALDLACGEGRNAIWLARRGWQVTGIDFSAIAIDRARRIAAESELPVDLRTGDVLTFPIPDGAFDLVLVAYVQLPPKERALLITRAAKGVSPAGRFLLVAHDHANHAHGHGGPKDASLLWTADEVVAHLEGFVVEEAQTVLRPVDGAKRPAIDTIVSAVRTAGTASTPTRGRAAVADSRGR